MAGNFSRARRFAKILLTNFVLLICLLFLVEIICHLFPIIKIEWVEGNYQTGFDILPNYIERLPYPEHSRGEVLYKSNNLGFREDEATLMAKTDSVRIVVLGDSHTDGVCWNDESYPNRLEALLNGGASNTTFEVINAGTGKYSPFQYLRSYQYRIRPLKPDLVIVGLYIGNDFFDMYRRDDRPSCALNKKGDIVELPPQFYFYAKPGFTNTWLSKSYVYYILFGSRFLKTLSYPISRGIVFYRNFKTAGDIGSREIVGYFRDLNRASAIHRQATTQAMAQRIFFERFPTKQPESERLLEYVLRELKKETASDGAGLLIAPIPTKFQIEPARIKDLTMFLRQFPYLENESDFENHLYDNVLEMCSQLGINFVDLRQPLIEAANEMQLYFDTDFHINPAANKIIAAALYEGLLRNGYFN